MRLLKCAVCDFPLIEKEKGERFCPTCKTNLARLVQVSTPLGDSSIELRNVRLNTDIEGTGFVVAIEGGGTNGWQHPFGINGSTKCIICQSLAEDRPVCDACDKTVRELSAKVEVLMRIIDVMDDVEWMVKFMSLMGKDVVKKWMAKELDVDLEDEEPDT